MKLYFTKTWQAYLDFSVYCEPATCLVVVRFLMARKLQNLSVLLSESVQIKDGRDAPLFLGKSCQSRLNLLL